MVWLVLFVGGVTVRGLVVCDLFVVLVVVCFCFVCYLVCVCFG